MKMLFMDDVPEFLAIQTEMFRRSGYDVIACNLTAQAEEVVRVQGNSIDVAVLDMKMYDDEAAGLRLASVIRDSAPLVPSVVLTGYANCPQESLAIMEGICAYVAKLGTTEMPVGNLDLALRYSHEQRVARLRTAIERSVVRWWQDSASANLKDSLITKGGESVMRGMMQHYRIFCGMMNRSPMPSRNTVAVPLLNLLPIEAKVGDVIIQNADSEIDLTPFRIRSEVGSLPSIDDIIIYLSRNGFGQRVRCECQLSISEDRAMLLFIGDGHADGAFADRINQIAKGADIQNEQEALLAIWFMQLSAFSGLAEMKTLENATQLKITMPVVP